MYSSSLVILGSTETALAVARDPYARRLGAVVIATRNGPAALTRVARVEILPSADDVTVLARLQSLGRGSSFLIATEDAWLRFIVRHRTALDAAFANILHPPNSALEICLDKRKFSAWCEERGFPVPVHWSAEEATSDPRVRYPLLLRPEQTSHDRGGVPKTVEIHTAAELELWLKRFSAAGATPLLTESLLGVRLVQYSVPFARSGGAIRSYVARKVRPPAEWCRVGTYVEMSPNPEVEELARRTVEALDYYGIGEVEVLHAVDSRRNYLIEINARPWGQYSMAVRSRHNLLGFAIDPSLDTGVQPIKDGIRWIDFNSDAYTCFSRSEGMVARGQIGLFEYLRSLMRANSYARFKLSDPRPFLAGYGDFFRLVIGRVRNAKKA